MIGIVKEIDNLGRIVIPKEIRRTLRIREGDSLEIFTDRQGEIILKKYSPIGEMSNFAKDYAESLANTLGTTICITDHDQIIAAAGYGKKELQDKYITKRMESTIADREQVIAYHGEKDTVVPASQSEIMVDFTKQHGGTAELNILKDMGHNDGIDYAYRETDLIERLISYRKSDFAHIPEVCEDLF